jgi:hypothetical protein
MNSYSIKCTYQDRKVGPEGRTIKVDASTIAGAIAKAAREFVKGLDRRQRFDANKGLTLVAIRVEDAASEPGKLSSEQAATA